jgi:zinc/manganese transport system substrate-binding protein
MPRHPFPIVAVTLAGALLAAACGGGDGAAGGDGGGPDVVVTTSVLGDVVENLVGDAVEVDVIMPPNADPHDFQASAQQAAALREADLVVVNGAGFEAGLDEAIDGAVDDGATVFTAVDHVDTLPATGEGADEHAEEGGESGDEHAEESGGVDPHFFTDPARMATATEALADALADNVSGLDDQAFRDRASGYVDQLRALDAEVEATLAPVPAENRKLVTNHDVFSYFAGRYGFTVVGTVIPAISTAAEPSAGELDELAATIQAEGVRAVFADTSSPEALADALAAEVGGDVQVVELYSESLGEPGSEGGTYVDMIRTDATRIAGALTP